MRKKGDSPYLWEYQGDITVYKNQIITKNHELSLLLLKLSPDSLENSSASLPTTNFEIEWDELDLCSLWIYEGWESRFLGLSKLNRITQNLKRLRSCKGIFISIEDLTLFLTDHYKHEARYLQELHRDLGSFQDEQQRRA